MPSEADTVSCDSSTGLYLLCRSDVSNPAGSKKTYQTVPHSSLLSPVCIAPQTLNKVALPANEVKYRE